MTWVMLGMYLFYSLLNLEKYLFFFLDKKYKLKETKCAFLEIPH